MDGMTVVKSMIVKWGWKYRPLDDSRFEFKSPRWRAAYTGTVALFNTDGKVTVDPAAIDTDRIFFVDVASRQVMWCDASVMAKEHQNAWTAELSLNQMPKYVRRPKY